MIDLYFICPAIGQDMGEEKKKKDKKHKKKYVLYLYCRINKSSEINMINCVVLIDVN